MARLPLVSGAKAVKAFKQCWLDTSQHYSYQMGWIFFEQLHSSSCSTIWTCALGTTASRPGPMDVLYPKSMRMMPTLQAARQMMKQSNGWIWRRKGGKTGNRCS